MKKKFARLAFLVFTLAMMPLLQGCYDGGVSYAFAWTPATGGIFVAGSSGQTTGGGQPGVAGGGSSGYP